MKKKFMVSTPADFSAVITELLESWNDSSQPLVIALSGDLGVGKTTFVQQLGQHLQVTEPITSPTFTIMKHYPLDNPRFSQLIHVDAYRIEDESEAGPLHLGELFQQAGNIICVEWPEKLPAILPAQPVRLTISINPDESRLVEMTF
jgi:tRNA threonylcarbamoyl adenosine modification protein YjeE